MKKYLMLIFLLLLTVFINSSCEFVFGPRHDNKIGKDLIIDYNIGDIFIYTTEDAKSDTFEVTLFKHSYDESENVENISVNLNYRYISNKAFISFVNPYHVVFKYNYNDDFVIYADRTPKIDLEINGSYYNDIFIYENDAANGNSDTLISKLMYIGNIGILGYEYENGDEYLLDTIIKVE